MATSKLLVRRRMIETRYTETDVTDLRRELAKYIDLVNTNSRGKQKFALRKEVREKVERLSEPVEAIGNVKEIQPFRPVMVELASADHVGFFEFEGKTFGILKYLASAYSLAGFAFSIFGALKSMTEVFIAGIFSGIARGTFALACHYVQKKCKAKEENAKQQFLEALEKAAPFLRDFSN